jgi:hypothetical protein
MAVTRFSYLLKQTTAMHDNITTTMLDNMTGSVAAGTGRIVQLLLYSVLLLCMW